LSEIGVEPLAPPDRWSRYYQAHVDLSAVLEQGRWLREERGVPFGWHFDELAERPSVEGFFVREPADHRWLDPLGPSRELPIAQRAFRVACAIPARAVTGGGRGSVVQLYWRNLLNAVAPSPPHSDMRAVAQPTPIAHRIDVQQTIRGAPVVGGTFRLHVDKGVVYAVTGRPTGGLERLDPGEPPRRDRASAETACLNIFGDEAIRVLGVREVVFPLKEQAMWAFEVTFVDEDTAADVRAYLAADDLSLLLSHNIASALTGRGRVFRVNPRRTPNLEDVDLDGIGPMPPDRLSGSVVEVRPSKPPAVQRRERNFLLDPDDRAFDEVQAYYHLWSISSRFRQLLPAAVMAGDPLAPIHAIVHEPRTPGNAFYIPDTRELWFGDLPGGRSTARSADIVYHEYVHAVTDKLCQLGRSKTEGAQSHGLSEGYSDYFACSTLGDPRFGDYAMNAEDGFRNCAKQGVCFAPDFAGSLYSTGEVWSSVLWAIRSEIGAADADTLAVASLEFLGPESTFEDGLAALITSDRKLFTAEDGQGRHEHAIAAAFDARRG
jgi:hypothetical protein